MRRLACMSLVLLLLIFIQPTGAQTGTVNVEVGDVLNYSWTDVDDPNNFLDMLGQSVSTGDTFSFIILDNDAEDKQIDANLSFKGASEDVVLQVDFFDFVMIPDWGYWENYLGNFQTVTFTVGSTVVLEESYVYEGVYNSYRMEYTLDGILINLYDYYEDDVTGSHLLTYGYNLDSYSGGYEFNEEYGFENGDIFEFVVELYESELTIPFFETANDELYLLEGDKFTIEIGSLPNNNDEVLLRINSESENIAIITNLKDFKNIINIDKLITDGISTSELVNPLIYTDFEVWLDVLQDTQEDLDSGEFLQFTFEKKLEVNYIFSGDDYISFTVIYNMDGILEFFEFESATIQGDHHFIIEMVKDSPDRRGNFPSVILGLGGILIIVKLRKNKSK